MAWITSMAGATIGSAVVPSTVFGSGALEITNYVPQGKKPIAFAITSGSTPLESAIATIWTNLAANKHEVTFRSWANLNRIDDGTVAGIVYYV